MATDKNGLSADQDNELNTRISELIDAGASDSDIESFTNDYVKKKVVTTQSESQSQDGAKVLSDVSEQSKQGAEPLSQPTEKKEPSKLPETYVSNRSNYKDLVEGQDYILNRGGKPITGKWDATKQEFVKNPLLDTTPKEKTKGLIEGAVEMVAAGVPLKSYETETDVLARNAVEAENLKQEAAQKALHANQIAKIPEINQLDELYKQLPSHPELQKQIDEISNTPITEKQFQGTRFISGSEGKVFQNIDTTIPTEEYNGKMMPMKNNEWLNEYKDAKTIGDVYNRVKEDVDYVQTVQAETNQFEDKLLKKRVSDLPEEEQHYLKQLEGSENYKDEALKILQNSNETKNVIDAGLLGIYDNVESVINTGNNRGLSDKQWNEKQANDFMYDNLFKKHPVTPAQQFTHSIGNMIPSLAAAPISGGASLSLMAYPMMHEYEKEYYRDAIVQGKTPKKEDAEQYAMASTATQMTMLLGAGAVGGKAMQLVGKSKLQRVGELLLEVGKRGAKDAIGFGIGGAYLQNKINKAFDVSENDDYARSALNMGLIGSTFGLVHGLGQTFKFKLPKSIVKEIDYHASYLPKEITATEIEKLISSGKMSTAEGLETDRKIDRFRQIRNQLNVDLSFEQMESIDKLWVEKQKLEESMSDASPEIKNIIKGKIDDLDRKVIVESLIPLSSNEKEELKKLTTKRATEGNIDEVRLKFLQERKDAIEKAKLAEQKKQEQDDKKNIAGVQGSERIGEEPIQTEPNKTSSGETSETSGNVLQNEQEEVEVVSGSALKDVESTAKALEGNKNILPNIINKIKNVFFTGRGKKYDDLQKTKGDFIFFSKNKKNAEWYGGDESNVSEAFIDDSEYLDLTSQSKKSKFVEENFTDDDILKLYKTEIDYEIERDRFGRKTKDQLIEKYRDRARDERFSGDGKEQKFLLEKAKSLGVKGIKLLDTFFGKSDVSTIAIDKSTIKTINSKNVSEAYHKAKADGTNPELVKAVEDLLGKATTQYTEAAGVSGSALKDVESTAKALGKKEPDENNQIYYHATDNNDIILPTDDGYKKREGKNVVNQGIYFGKDKQHLTDRYGVNAIKVLLKIKKPLITNNAYIDIDGRNIDYRSLSKEDIDYLKSKGYDSIQYKSADKKYSSWDETVVFDKNQVIKINDKLSEAYHKAKADGTNPELVKAVEDLLGKAPTQYTEAATLKEQPKAEEVKAEVETPTETIQEKGRELTDAELKQRLLDDVDLFDMAMGKEPLPKEIKTAIDNGEITREQADGFIEQDESVIEDIERKAESEDEKQRNEAIDQADKLIGEAVGATESKAEPTDKGTGENKVTGIKKAMLEKDRQDAGLPPIELPKSNKPQEQLERAKELVDSGEIDPSELEAYLISHAENPSDAKTSEADQYILQYQRMKIEARSKEILTERIAIEDRLKADPTDVQANMDLASNEIARQQNIYDLDRNTTASRITSNIWGKLGNAKQQVINERGIVQEQINRIKELHGKEVPKEVQDKLDSLEKKNTELTARIEAIEKNITEQIAQGQLNKESRKPLIRRANRRSDEEINAQIKDKLSTIANKIAERIEKSTVKNFAANKEQSKSLIAEIAPDVMDVVKLVSEKTGNKLEDVVNKTYDTIKDVIDGIEKKDIYDVIAGKYSNKKPLSELQKQMNDLRSQAKLKIRLEEIENKIEKETKARGESSPEVKALKKELSELQSVEGLKKRIEDARNGIEKVVKEKGEQSEEVKSLRKELSDLESQNRIKARIEDLQNGVVRETKARGESSPEVKALKKELSELQSVEGLKKRIEDVKNGVEKKVKEKGEQSDEVKALRKELSDLESQDRLKKRIEDLQNGVLRETKARGEASPEVKKLKKQADELNKKNKKELANFSANELKKQVEQLQKKIDKGDFLPQKTVKKAFEQDANWVKYSQEKKKLKQELNHLEAQALYDKKNLYMKTLDQFNKFSRLGLFIFSTAYQLKLGAAALSTAIHKPIEDLVGTAIKPMVREIADRAPIEGRNINAEATAEFYKNFSPIKILRGAYQILSKGETELSRELSSHPKKEGNIFNPLSDHSVINWIADDPHKIIKNPIKQGIFDASLANYMNYYASKGMDINDPVLIEKARQASYMRAEYEIFMGGEHSKNAVAEWFKKMETEGILDAQSESFKTKAGGNLKYSISALKNFIVPIASVPANILNRTVKNNPISTAYRFSEALKTNSELKNNVTETLDNLTEAQADLMLRDLKKGAIGSVYWTLGFIMAGNALGGFFNKSYPDKKREKNEKGHDEMEIFGKNIPHGVQHAVPLQQMQMAATFALTLKYFNEQDKLKLKDDFSAKDEAKNVVAGGAEVARTYINEHPLSKASLDVYKAIEGGKGREKYFNSLYRRSDVPQTKFLLQDVGLIKKDESYEKQKEKSAKHKEVKDLYDVFWYMMNDKEFEKENQ